MTEWRPVLGFEGYYEVSDDGLARSVERVVPHGDNAVKTLRSVLLKPSPQKPSGHLYVSLYREHKRYHRALHRMVLEAFVGACPDGQESCHRDGDSSNNTLANLYWGTRAENIQDSLRHGTHPWAKRTHCANGHEFTPENTFDRGRGRRGCRACNRVWQAAYKARQKAKGAA